MEGDKNIHFHLSDKNANMMSTSKDVNENKPIEYILNQNDQLNKAIHQVKDEMSKMELKYKDKIEEIKKERDELEYENDKLEKSKTMLKGYLQNELEANKYNNQIVEFYEDEHIKYFKELYEDSKNVLKLFGILMIGMIAFEVWKWILQGSSFFNWCFFVGQTVYLVFTIPKFFNFLKKIFTEYKNIKNIKTRDYLKGIKKELEETKKGNQYLDDLLDGL